MLISPKMLLCAAIVAASLPAMAQAKLTGKVTQQVGGSVGHLPETRPLSGATVIVGTDIDLEVGQAGIDRVRGRVAAKEVSKDGGTFVIDVPAGRYTVICWKEGYVPQIENNVRIPGRISLDISKDSSMRGLHRQLSYAK